MGRKLRNKLTKMQMRAKLVDELQWRQIYVNFFKHAGIFTISRSFLPFIRHLLLRFCPACGATVHAVVGVAVIVVYISCYVCKQLIIS